MKLPAWIFALLACALTLGCDSGGRVQNSTDVRALNAVADGETVDFLVDDGVVATGLAVGSASPYANVPFGERNVKIRSTGASATLTEIAANLGPNGFYTVFVHGRRGAAVAALANEDNGVLPPDRIRGRLVALDPDAPSLDLYLSPTAELASTTTPTQVAVAYPGIGGYVDSPAGRYFVILTASGTQEILFRSAAQEISAGTKFSVVAMPTPGGRLVGGVLLPTRGEAIPLANAFARVKALNARPESAPINFLADGAMLFSSVPYAATSDYLATAAGTRALRIDLASVPGTALATLSTGLASSRDYTLVAAGTATAPRLLAFADDNTIPATSGVTRVRFINLRTDGVAASVTVGGTSQVASLPAETASGYVTLTGGSAQSIQFFAPGSTTPVAAFSQTFDISSVYTVYLLGNGAALTVRAVRDR